MTHNAQLSRSIMYTRWILFVTLETFSPIEVQDLT